VIVQEPNPADEPAAVADVDEPALEGGDVTKCDDPLAPGDSDLADAWWAL
jgi:hypothetical protein